MKRLIAVGIIVVGLSVGLSAPAFAGTRNITVTGTVSEATAVKVNGVSATVDAQGSFSAAIVLSEGDNTITAEATDAVGNKGQVSVMVNLDTVAPIINITSPTDGALFGAN